MHTVPVYFPALMPFLGKQDSTIFGAVLRFLSQTVNSFGLFRRLSVHVAREEQKRFAQTVSEAVCVCVCVRACACVCVWRRSERLERVGEGGGIEVVVVVVQTVEGTRVSVQARTCRAVNSSGSAGCQCFQ